jgi:hypothetical protein
MAARMALRPPLRPSGDTVARFFFEIVTITAGILIALWIDGVKETRRDDALVRTAREQLAREIADNLRDIEQTESSRDEHAVALTQALEFVESRSEARTTPSPPPTKLGLSSPSFPRSSWDTAGRTGALALMDYGDVKTFSEIYDLQDLVDRTQEQYVERLTQGSATFMTLIAGQYAGTPDRAALETARIQGMTLSGAFRFYRQLMAQLVDQYKKVQPR